MPTKNSPTGPVRIQPSRLLFTLTALAVLLIMGTIVAGSLLMKPGSTQTSASRAVEIARSSEQDPERIETELVTITNSGFEPTEIRRPAGTFYLQVENRSEMRLDLRLDQAGRESIKSRTVDLKTLEWREELNLAPGEYVLTASTRPGWQCRLTITAK